MQVAQPGPSPSLAEPSERPLPVCNPAPSVDQFIHVHELDSNSMELDLQFSEEEKRLLLDKQSAANPWYTHIYQTCKHTFSVYSLNNLEMPHLCFDFSGTSLWRITSS